MDQDEHMPRREVPARLRSVSLPGLFVLAVFYTLYLGRPIFMPIAVATLLSFVLHPIVSMLKNKLRLPRPMGTTVLVGGVLALFVVAVLRLSAPASLWMERIPEAMRSAEWEIRELKAPIDRMQEATEQIEEMAEGEQEYDDPPTVRIKRTSYMELFLSQTWGLLAGAAITIALLYFFLASGDIFLRKLVHVLPTLSHKREAVITVEQVRHDISVYILSITVINAGLGVATGLAMYLLGLPDAVLWGLMAMLLNYIPYAGAIVGTAVVGLVTLATQDASHAILVMAVYYSLTLIEGTFVTPMLLGRRLMLNPVVIFASLLLWGWMWGIVGALIAVPLVAAFKIICDHVRPLQPVGELLGR